MNRPRVIMHSVVSVDGRLTTAPGVLLLFGDPRWSAVAGDSSDVYARLMADYQPTALLEEQRIAGTGGRSAGAAAALRGRRRRTVLGLSAGVGCGRAGPQVVHEVVSGRGRVRGWMKEYPGEEWAGWHLLVLVCRSTPPDYLAYLQSEGLPYLVAGTERVDLAAALGELADRLGGGNGRLDGRGPVERGAAARRAGGRREPGRLPGDHRRHGHPGLADGPALAPEEVPIKLALKDCAAQEGGHLWLRYDVVKG